MMLYKPYEQFLKERPSGVLHEKYRDVFFKSIAKTDDKKCYLPRRCILSGKKLWLKEACLVTVYFGEIDNTIKVWVDNDVMIEMSLTVSLMGDENGF